MAALPGDGGTTEQLRFFATCVAEGRPIGLPAANLDEAIKTMEVPPTHTHTRMHPPQPGW